jgi:hypothetical protein
MDYNNIQNTVVCIYCISESYDITRPYLPDNTKKKHGSGFFASKNIIITCYHVISNAKSIKFSLNTLSKQKYNVYPLAISFVYDIAVLYSPDYTSDCYINIYSDINPYDSKGLISL